MVWGNPTYLFIYLFYINRNKIKIKLNLINIKSLFFRNIISNLVNIFF